MKTNFSYNLESIRAKKKLSKVNLAEQLSISLKEEITEKDMTNWENGSDSPNPNVYPILSELLNVPLTDLFKDIEKKEVKPIKQEKSIRIKKRDIEREDISDFDKGTLTYKGKTAMGRKMMDIYVGFHELNKTESNAKMRYLFNFIHKEIEKMRADPEKQKEFEEFKKNQATEKEEVNPLINKLIELISSSDDKKIILNKTSILYKVNGKDKTINLDTPEPEIWKIINNSQIFRFKNLNESGVEIYFALKK